ncbi:MAG: MFS transporter [Thermoguttaceae bacterium]
MSDNNKLTLAQWYVLLAAFLGWMFDGLEMGLFPIAARPALIDLLNSPAESVIGEWYSYMVAAFLLGAALGGLVFGWLGDRLGRVRTMALSIAVYAGFTGLCFFADTPMHLILFRFCAAVGMGGEWALGVALIMECWPEKYRPILAGVIGAAANVGFLFISLVAVKFAVNETNWRWMMLAGAAPGVLCFFILALIPESERWKESVKAGSSKPLREIFGRALIKQTLFGTVFASVALIGTWGAISGFLPPWTDQIVGGDRVLAVTANVRPDAPGPVTAKMVEMKDKAVVSEAGSGSAVATGEEKPKYKVSKLHSITEREPVAVGQPLEYRIKVTNQGAEAGSSVTYKETLDAATLDLASVKVEPKQGQAEVNRETGELLWTIGDLEFKDSKAKAWVQTVISIGAIIGCFVGALLGNWLGRRPAYFLLCLLSLISCQYLFRYFDEYNLGFLTLVGIVGLVTASFYGWAPLYLPELFPTRVRATGQGVSFNSGRILAAVGALSTGQMMKYWFDGSYPKACATLTLVYIIGMIVIWFAPETKGKPLPE